MKMRNNMSEILKVFYVMIIFIFMFCFLNGITASKSLLSSFSNNFVYYTPFVYLISLTLQSLCFTSQDEHIIVSTMNNVMKIVPFL